MCLCAVWQKLNSTCFLWLRQYTPEFGDKIAEECSRLLAACPKTTDPEEGVDPIQMWISWEWGDCWDGALMKELVQYLYGARDLRVPPEWKPNIKKRAVKLELCIAGLRVKTGTDLVACLQVAPELSLCCPLCKVCMSRKKRTAAEPGNLVVGSILSPPRPS